MTSTQEAWLSPVPLNDSDLDLTIGILHDYWSRLAPFKPNDQERLNGCRKRARRMKEEFNDIGYPNSEVVVVNSFGEPFEHESGSYLYHHCMLFLQGLLFDPNYTGASPLTIDNYSSIACPGEDMHFWKAEDDSAPLNLDEIAGIFRPLPHYSKIADAEKALLTK